MAATHYTEAVIEVLGGEAKRGDASNSEIHIQSAPELA